MIFSDENIPLLVAALAFVIICLLTLGLIIHFRAAGHRRRLIEKMRPEDTEGEIIEKDAQSLDITGKQGGPFARFLSSIGMKTSPGMTADDAEIKLKFLKAGLRRRNVPTIFWGTKFLLAVGLPTLFATTSFLFFKVIASSHILPGTMFFAALGLILPDMWLRVRTSKRKERLAKGLPDALDLMVVCVEAGMGLDAAISRVGEELSLSHPELSRELNILNLEMRAGKSRDVALKNLADRMDNDDVHSLVTLLIQTDRFGTSVAQALRVFSESFRTARYQRAEEIAAKIGTKLIFPLVLFIFPSLFVVTLGPALITAYRWVVKG